MRREYEEDYRRCETAGSASGVAESHLLRSLDRIADALEGVLCELKKSNKIKLRGALIDVPPDMEASKHVVTQTEKEVQDAEG